MRLLVDECCDPALVTALRASGHDVHHILESAPGSNDETVLALAQAEGRVLITEDKDFGELALRHGKAVPGVILMRFAPGQRHRKTPALLALLTRHKERLVGGYAVLEESGVRLRPLPTTA